MNLVNIRVLLVDDHPVVLGGLKALLSTIDGIDVVGVAGDGQSAIEQAQVLTPDVVLMDLRMPGMDGIEATRRVRAAVPTVAVLVLTMYDDDASVLTAMQAGAGGYLLKGAEQDEIVGAIRAVAAGQAIFGPGIAARVLNLFSAAAAIPEKTDAFPQLTEREHEILALLAQGWRTARIAQELYLAPKTVSNHLSSIFAKLQVTDRASAIIRAREGGLGTS